jgi:hypothetical protein
MIAHLLSCVRLLCEGCSVGTEGVEEEGGETEEEEEEEKERRET